MSQKDDVVLAMRQNGGYATFKKLNQSVDISTWKTKTPEASIRQIVQIYPELFFKIKPGLWALQECRAEVLERLCIAPNDDRADEMFTHTYYQGIIVEIGNKKGYKTYVPPQDKNKEFLETKLSELTSTDKLPEFSYESLIRRARTVDVIWFNERNMPCGFYEVEHTTDIKNSLNKFYELQDFRAEFKIIADEKRKEQFMDIMSASIYNPIRNLVNFMSYENLIKQYEKEKIVLDDVL